MGWKRWVGKGQEVEESIEHKLGPFVNYSEVEFYF